MLGGLTGWLATCEKYIEKENTATTKEEERYKANGCGRSCGGDGWLCVCVERERQALTMENFVSQQLAKARNGEKVVDDRDDDDHDDDGGDGKWREACTKTQQEIKEKRKGTKKKLP